MAFVDTATRYSKLWDVFSIIAHVKWLVFLSLRKKSERHQKKGVRLTTKTIHKKKCYKVMEMYECDCWNLYKTDNFVEQHLREVPNYEMPHRGEFFSETIKSGSLFAYVQCGIKVPRIADQLLQTFQASSRILMLVEMTLLRLWENMPRKKEFWLSLKHCQYQAFSWRMEQSLHRCCLFHLTLGLVCKKTFVLCNTHQWSASTTPFSLQWMLEKRQTRIQTLVLWLREWSYLRTVLMVIRLWIAFNIQWESVSVMQSHMELSITKCSSARVIPTINFMRWSLSIHILNTKNQ